MSYITSNDNRFYVARETAYGSVPAIAAENRIPAVRLSAKQSIQQANRRDKTGGRSYLGSPAGSRKTTQFDLTTYLTAWTDQTAPPAYSPLFESAMGESPLISNALTVQSVQNGTRISFGGAHGLSAGQAVSHGGEMRFVTALVDNVTVEVNAPFTTAPPAGSTTARTVTYKLGRDIPSLSIFDFWSPENSVQRILQGAAVNEMRLGINSDFHEFRFAGPARDVIDSLTFADSEGELSTFPEEPEIEAMDLTVVPGNIGQVWLGSTASRFYTLTQAEVVLNNGLETRTREFGIDGPRCVVPGERKVTAAFELYASTEEETLALYQAAREKSPFRTMIQLGDQSGQLFGVYMKSLVAEMPDFKDTEPRLLWQFRECRAQGSMDDEIVIAFA